jgi:hypothetical protein
MNSESKAQKGRRFPGLGKLSLEVSDRQARECAAYLAKEIPGVLDAGDNLEEYLTFCLQDEFGHAFWNVLKALLRDPVGSAYLQSLVATRNARASASKRSRNSARQQFLDWVITEYIQHRPSKPDWKNEYARRYKREHPNGPTDQSLRRYLTQLGDMEQLLASLEA